VRHTAGIHPPKSFCGYGLAFIAEAERQHLEIREVSGDKVADLIRSACAFPPDVVKAANEAMALTGAANE
jgi:hypothetical protein